MKRVFTLILAVAALGTLAQDRGGKKEIAEEKSDIRSNVQILKRDMAEVEAMRAAQAEFDVQMTALNFDEMQSAKNAMLKLMDKEIDQARTRVGMDRAEMMRSIEEAERARKEAAETKVAKKPVAVADDRADARDDRADAKDDRSDFEKQKALILEMNRLFHEIRKIELTTKPQRHYEGSILKKADQFIQLMQNDIFETKREVKEDREEIIEDREEAAEDKKRRKGKRKQAIQRA